MLPEVLLWSHVFILPGCSQVVIKEICSVLKARLSISRFCKCLKNCLSYPFKNMSETMRFCNIIHLISLSLTSSVWTVMMVF